MYLEFFYDLKKLNLWRFIYKQTTTGAFIKKMGDIVELEMRNLRDKYKLSKKLGKSFFKISSKQVKSFRSIKTRSHIANYFHGNLFCIQNFFHLVNRGEKYIFKKWIYESSFFINNVKWLDRKPRTIFLIFWLYIKSNWFKRTKKI